LQAPFKALNSQLAAAAAFAPSSAAAVDITIAADERVEMVGVEHGFMSWAAGAICLNHLRFTLRSGGSAGTGGIITAAGETLSLCLQESDADDTAHE
jgi:hypothetical protein